MATLIVTSPRPFANGWRIRILIDGRIAATIANRESTEIDLPPGRHQITAKHSILGSQPVQIEAGPEGVHHLRVGSHVDRLGSLKFAFYSMMLAPVAASILLSFASLRLFSDPFEVTWFTRFVFPLEVMLSLPLVALLAIYGNRILFLEEIPTSDHAGRPVSPPRSRPLRVRITIRGLMVAVAILAILFGAGVEWMRFTRRGFYRTKATVQSQLEATFRDLAQKQERSLAEFEQAAHQRASLIRQWAARSAAKADYHAVLKRKYEEAAARRAFSVEPDPPAPPWP